MCKVYFVLLEAKLCTLNLVFSVHTSVVNVKNLITKVQVNFLSSPLICTYMIFFANIWFTIFNKVNENMVSNYRK